MTDQELIEKARSLLAPESEKYFGTLIPMVKDLASALSASLEREKGMRAALEKFADGQDWLLCCDHEAHGGQHTYRFIGVEGSPSAFARKVLQAQEGT